MKINRRNFIAGITSVATMGNTKIPLSSMTKGISGISGSFNRSIISQNQVHHLYEFLGKTLPNNYIDYDNIDIKKLRLFQQGLIKSLGNSHINEIKNLGTVRCAEDLAFWMTEAHSNECKKTIRKYNNWFQGLPKNIRNNIIGDNNPGLNILFNEDSIVDHAICSIQGIETPSEESLFSYLRTSGELRKGDIKMEFFFDSRDYNKRWKYRLINNSIQEGTTDMVVNPSELSQILEMPESSLKEIMDKSEKIKLKQEKKNSDKIDQNKIEANENISSFKSFLLGTTYVTNITEYTKNQSQEILDYLDEKEIKNLVKID